MLPKAKGVISQSLLAAKLSAACCSTMEHVINLQTLGESSSIRDALSSLRSGEVIAFPTDTIYGISCLAQNTDGIRKLYEIKRRDLKKPVAICVGDASDIDR